MAKLRVIKFTHKFVSIPLFNMRCRVNYVPIPLKNVLLLDPFRPLGHLQQLTT